MIAHVDADSFFASVLVRKYPHLKGKSLLALGMGGRFVIAASYEAKALGVKTGMRLSDALKLAPSAVRMPSDFAETGLASDQIEGILRDYCPLIEQMSIDEWYLDLTSLVGGLPADLVGWATGMRGRILSKTSLSVSIGIGPSKLLAKMAGEYRKPGGITVIGFSDPAAGSHGSQLREEGLSLEKFLRDRPAAAIPGIGRKRMIHTERLGWKTAWDVATGDRDTIVRLFGRPGAELQRELLGEPLSPVAESHDPQKSISRARSFRAERDRIVLFAHVLRHLEYTVLKMRRQRLACRGVGVWLRGKEYTLEHANHRLPQPLDTEEQIRPYVETCFRALYKPRTAYTQTGFVLWDLCSVHEKQYSLFESPEATERSERMQRALDALHERFGRDAITRAAAMKVRSGSKKNLGLPMMG